MYGASIPILITHVLREETHSIDYPDGRKVSSVILGHRLYYFQNIVHDGTKYITPVTPPIILVTKGGGRGANVPRNAYDMTPHSSLVDVTLFPYVMPLRAGLNIKSFRMDEQIGQIWLPNNADMTVVFNILNNDSDRNGDMYAANTPHDLVIYLRFRKDLSTLSPEFSGIGIEAVHAFNLTQIPGQNDNGDFLSFFL